MATIKNQCLLLVMVFFSLIVIYLQYIGQTINYAYYPQLSSSWKTNDIVQLPDHVLLHLIHVLDVDAFVLLVIGLSLLLLLRG